MKKVMLLVILFMFVLMGCNKTIDPDILEQRIQGNWMIDHVSVFLDANIEYNNELVSHYYLSGSRLIEGEIPINHFMRLVIDSTNFCVYAWDEPLAYSNAVSALVWAMGNIQITNVGYNDIQCIVFTPISNTVGDGWKPFVVAGRDEDYFGYKEMTWYMNDFIYFGDCDMNGNDFKIIDIPDVVHIDSMFIDWVQVGS